MDKEIVKQKLKDIITNKTIIACIVLVAIFLAGGYCQYLGIGVIVGAAIFFAIMPIQQSFCLFLFLQSYCYKNGLYGTYIVATFICFILNLFVRYIIGVKKGKYKLYIKHLIAMAVFLVFYICISFFHRLFAEGATYAAYVPLIYLMFAMREDFNLKEGMAYLLGGFISSAILALIVSVLPGYHYEIFPMEHRFIALSAHPNHIHIRGIFLICYYMYRYLAGKLSTLKFALIYVSCAIITILCRSKTGILLLAFFTLLFIILYLKEDFKHRIKFVGIVVAILAVAACIGYKQILAILNRFVSGDGDFLTNLTTERNYIWLDYLKTIVKSPLVFLFGHGFLADEVYIVMQEMARAPHSLYIFLLFRFGFMGCIALMYLLVMFIKELNKQRPKLINAIPIIWVCIIGLIENIFNFFGIIYIILSFMILFDGVKEKLPVSEEENVPVKTNEKDLDKKEIINEQ